MISCKDRSTKTDGDLNKAIYRDTIDEKTYLFDYDSNTSKFHFDINDSTIFRQSYTFDKYGCLIEKIGLNFWGEEEKYVFDQNNTLVEFRKSVRLNSRKFGLQEIMRYKNGVVDNARSHYFNFEVIDSTENDYKVHIEYIGALQVLEMSIFVNDFSYSLEELDLKSPLISTKNNSITFWTKRDSIYQDDFGNLQISVAAKFIHDGKLLVNLGHNKSTFTQKFILRKWR